MTQRSSPVTDSPAVALELPVAVYDGECPFCRKQIDRLRARDVDDVFDYAPRQTPGLDERFPALSEGDFNSGMRLIHPDGTISVGADAVYEMSRKLKGYRQLAWLYRVPGLQWIFRKAYTWVAKNRMRLAGGCEDACEI